MERQVAPPRPGSGRTLSAMARHATEDVSSVQGRKPLHYSPVSQAEYSSAAQSCRKIAPRKSSSRRAASGMSSARSSMPASSRVKPRATWSSARGQGKTCHWEDQKPGRPAAGASSRVKRRATWSSAGGLAMTSEQHMQVNKRARRRPGGLNMRTALPANPPNPAALHWKAHPR